MKNVLRSRRFWGALVALVGAISMAAGGSPISTEDQAVLVEQILGAVDEILTFGGLLLGYIGGHLARGPLTFGRSTHVLLPAIVIALVAPAPATACEDGLHQRVAALEAKEEWAHGWREAVYNSLRIAVATDFALAASIKSITGTKREQEARGAGAIPPGARIPGAVPGAIAQSGE